VSNGAMRKVRFVIIAAVCSLIALGFIWAYSFELEHRANRLVRVCYELSERGKPPSLEEIRNVFGSYLQQLGPCSNDGCGYEVNVSNGVLHAFHLVPYTNLRTQFWEQKGITQSNSVYFYTIPHANLSVLVKYCTACDPPNVYPYKNASTSFTGYVETDLSAPDVARKKVFGINTTWLTRWGGRDSTAQLLPTVWQKAGQNTVRCIIPNREGVFDLLQMK
jgi:hypothetical protein